MALLVEREELLKWHCETEEQTRRQMGLCKKNIGERVNEGLEGDTVKWGAGGRIQRGDAIFRDRWI